MRLEALARGHAAHAISDVGVVVEAEHGRGLRERLRKLLPVPLGKAAGDDDACTGVSGRQDRIDGVLLGRGHETAGIDEQYVDVASIVLHGDPVGDQACLKLVGVDVIARATQAQDTDPGIHPLRVETACEASGRGRAAKRGRLIVGGEQAIRVDVEDSSDHSQMTPGVDIAARVREVVCQHLLEQAAAQACGLCEVFNCEPAPAEGVGDHGPGSRLHGLGHALRLEARSVKCAVRM